MARRRKAARSFPPFLALSVLAVGALILVRAAVAVAYADRIYPGVTVGGVDLGGKSVAEAQVIVDQELNTYGRQTLTLRAGDRSLSMSPQKLGYRPQSAALVHAAYEVGRDGSLGGLLLGPFASHATALGIQPPLLIDSGTLDSAVAGIATEVNRPATNADLKITPQVALTPSRTGQELDKVGAKDELLNTLLALKTDPVDLPVRTTQPTITTDQLTPIKSQADALLGRSVSLTDGQHSWQIPPDELRAAVVYQPSPIGLDLTTAPFAPTVKSAAGQIEHPARDAALTIDSGKVTIQPDANGTAVDSAATLAALHDRLLAGDASIPVVVKTAPPAVTADSLKPLAAQAQKQIDAGLVLTADGQSFTIASADLAPMVKVDENGGHPRLTLDEAKVKSRIAQIDAQFREPSPDARIGWSGGHVVISSKTIPGIAIDENAAVTTVLANWGKGSVALPTTETKIPVDDALVARLNADLREVIGTRQTSYVGSIPERANNISLAMSKINGSYVAPGETFSFNRAVGPTTLEAGFQWGFGYSTGAGGSKVVPSVAGGICQVATTVFQPVFLAGYEVDERHWHMFPMSTYRVNGYWGLDATVDSESNLDMKFINGTSHGLLILASTTADHRAIVTLVSSRPDWKVQVSPEKLTDVTPAPTGVDRETSPLFQTGRTIILEEAQQGFVSHVTRTVTYPDGHVRTLNMVSKYQPSQESILVGTG
ncbi:MAG TPA: VanW family protein [Chloroflexota bacterium]|nr:VanW family protein [Chloroflexota bacterium]